MTNYVYTYFLKVYFVVKFIFSKYEQLYLQSIGDSVVLELLLRSCLQSSSLILVALPVARFILSDF